MSAFGSTGLLPRPSPAPQLRGKGRRSTLMRSTMVSPAHHSDLKSWGVWPAPFLTVQPYCSPPSMHLSHPYILSSLDPAIHRSTPEHASPHLPASLTRPWPVTHSQLTQCLPEALADSPRDTQSTVAFLLPVSLA